MRLVIRGQRIKLAEEDRSAIDRRLQFALARFTSRLTQVTVHLDEQRGARGESDKRCRIVVRFVPAGELVVEDTDVSLSGAVERAVDRIERAVRREIDRRRGQWPTAHVPRARP
ncbi:MAG: HPF/RaiA family ribosome-associated protein [Gemmataceae bacterium]